MFPCILAIFSEIPQVPSEEFHPCPWLHCSCSFSFYWLLGANLFNSIIMACIRCNLPLVSISSSSLHCSLHQSSLALSVSRLSWLLGSRYFFFPSWVLTFFHLHLSSIFYIIPSVIYCFSDLLWPYHRPMIEQYKRVARTLTAPSLANHTLYTPLEEQNRLFVFLIINLLIMIG